MFPHLILKEAIIVDTIRAIIEQVGYQGGENMILTFFDWIRTFDMKTINTDTVAQLLTTFSPYWNTVWAYVNQFLGEYFGF